MNPYDELGVRKDATEQEIKRAYRKRASATHPDKQSTPEGKSEAHDKFQRVNFSYKLLSDRSKREHYDKTGQIPEQEDTTFQKVMGQCYALMTQLLDTCDDMNALDAKDVMEIARNGVRDKAKEIKLEISKMNKQLAKRERVLKRLKKKGKMTHDMVGDVLRANMSEIRQMIEKAREALHINEELLLNLEDYSYLIEQSTEDRLMRERMEFVILGSRNSGGIFGDFKP